MKNSIIVFLSLFFLCNCTGKETSENSAQSNNQSAQIIKMVTDEQYESLTKDEQKLTDYINAGIAGIRGLNMSEDDKYIDYEAVVSVSLAEDTILSNHVIVSKMEKESQTSPRAADHGNCHVCGVDNAYDCIKKVKKYMQENHTTEINIHVKLSGGCVDIIF